MSGKLPWMNSKRSVLLLLLALFLLMMPAEAQEKKDTRRYKIVVAGFTIGEMIAEKTAGNGQSDYTVNSEVSFWFFGKINVDFRIRSLYDKEQLISSNAVSISNRGTFESDILWKEDYYEVDAHTYKFDNREQLLQPIRFSTVRFYFEEPKDGDIMVSETYGLLSRITEKSKGVYEIEIDGNRNQFYYKNGELDKIIIQNPIKNYVVQRVE